MSSNSRLLLSTIMLILQCSENELCCVLNILLTFNNLELAKIFVEAFEWLCHLVIFHKASLYSFGCIVFTLN